MQVNAYVYLYKLIFNILCSYAQLCCSNISRVCLRFPLRCNVPLNNGHKEKTMDSLIMNRKVR